VTLAAFPTALDGPQDHALVVPAVLRRFLPILPSTLAQLPADECLIGLDHAVKGGSRLAVDLELERALVDITRPREAVAASG